MLVMYLSLMLSIGSVIQSSGKIARGACICIGVLNGRSPTALTAMMCMSRKPVLLGRHLDLIGLVVHGHCGAPSVHIGRRGSLIGR